MIILNNNHKTKVMRSAINILSLGGLVLMVGCMTPQKNHFTSATTINSKKQYLCTKADTPIIIDGKLNEAAWQHADIIDKFYIYASDNSKTISATKARLLWDEDYLYVSIECEDDDIWSYSDKNDSDLWLGDASEIFIKPSPTSLSYCEFVVAPGGALFDACYPSRGAGGFLRFKNWSSNAKVATLIDGSDGDVNDTDSGYVVELRIPFSAFSKIVETPASGDIWMFAVCRYDYTKSYEAPLLIMSIPESKNYGFHYYEGYLPILFR